MREYGFYDSPVMRELERQEIAKNGPDKPIKKEAGVEPTDLLSKLANLSKNLRKSGRIEEANRLDNKVAIYVTAADKGTHLYRTHDEEGEDLIEFAHPDGDVEICPSSGGYGKIETQIGQHKKMVDMVQKEPTGNYATASILEDVAGVLGLRKKAEVDPTVNYNNNIAFVLEKFSIAENWSDKPNFYFTGNFATGTKGIGFDTVGGGLGSNIVVVERGQELQENKYVWNIKEEYLYRQVLGGRYPDGAQASIETFEKDHNNLIRSSQVEFSKKLQEQKGVVNSLMIVEGTDIKQLDRCINELHRLRGGGQSEARGTTIESFGTSVWKLYFVKNERMLNTIVEAMGVALSEALKIRDVLGKMEEWAQWQNRYKQGYVKPTVGRILKAMNYFNVNSVEALVPKIQEQIDEYANKKASARFRLEKKAQDFSKKPDTPPPAAAPAAAPPAAAQTGTETRQSASGGTGTRQPASGRRDINKRIVELNKWYAAHLPEYWKAVKQMQAHLHNLALTLKGRISPFTYSLLTGTAIKELRDAEIGPYDGQWGEGTAEALKAAKNELLKLNPDLAKEIVDGSPSGLMYYAGTDLEKQKEVGKIAEKNANIIAQIAGTSASGVASGTVFDYVPKNIDWSTDAFATTAPDKDLGDALAANNLSSLSAFSSWLELSYGDLGSDLSSNVKYLYDALKLLLNRATLLVKNNQAPATQAYVDAIKGLLTRTLEAFRSWQQKNPGKNPTVSDLEALMGSKSSKTTGTGTTGQLGEGTDIDSVSTNQGQFSINPLLGNSISPRLIARYAPETNIGRDLVNLLAPIINKEDVRTSTYNPESLFGLITSDKAAASWAEILQTTRYNPSAPATFFNGNGTQVPLVLTNGREKANATMMQLDRFRESPPAQRVLREWRLVSLIDILNKVKTDISYVCSKVAEADSDNTVLIQKIVALRNDWIQIIDRAIKSAQDSLRGSSSGRGQKYW